MFIGNKRTVQYLESVFRRGTLAHGYFFYGPRHLGKGLMADATAKAFLCEKEKKELGGCHQCRVCLQFGTGAAPGYLVLRAGEPIVDTVEKGKKEISIHEIREVRRRLGMSGRHAIIVDGAEELSDEAANAFLKILEEPRSDILFLFVSHAPTQVPSTILSRLVPLSFDYVPDEELLKVRGASPELLRLVGGAPGILVSLIEDADFRAKLASLYKEAEAVMGGTLAYAMGVSENLATKDELREFFVNYLFRLKQRGIYQAGEKAFRLARHMSRALEALHLSETTNVNKRLFLDIICMNLRSQ